MRLPRFSLRQERPVFGFPCDRDVSMTVHYLASKLGVFKKAVAEHCLHIGVVVALQQLQSEDTREELYEHLLDEHQASSKFNSKNEFDALAMEDAEDLADRQRIQELQAENIRKSRVEAVAKLEEEKQQAREKAQELAMFSKVVERVAVGLGVSSQVILNKMKTNMASHNSRQRPNNIQMTTKSDNAALDDQGHRNS